MHQKLKNKLIRIAARAPVLLLLVLAVTICHPIRADAEIEALEMDMTYFTKVGNYVTTETSGASLKKMFDFEGKVNLDDDLQYVAWYSIDTKASSDTTWHTKKVYVHSESWGTKVFLEPPDDNILTLDMVNTTSSKEMGKLGFKKYSNTLYGSHVEVPTGKVGTLFYFCVTSKTNTGRKFNKYLDKNNGTVSLKMSPLIKCSGGEEWLSADAWFKGHPWKDQNKQTYTDHYDVPIRFELDTIPVKSSAYVIGGRVSDNSDMMIAAKPSQLAGVKKPEPVTKDDYIFSPNEMLEVDDKPATTTDYLTVGDEAHEIKNPATGKKGKYLTVDAKDKNGNTVKMFCVGYRICKVLKDKTKVVLAESIINVTKDSTGQYIPRYVEDEDGKTIEVDSGKNGETLSVPADVLDRTITVARYNAYEVGVGGKRITDDLFVKEDEVTVKYWIEEAGKSVTWCLNSNFGIPTGKDVADDEQVSYLRVDWLYAPTGVTGEIKIMLNQYYTYETTNISTTEFPSVADSQDLQYTHNNNKGTPKLYNSEVLDTVNLGDPWVSYSVKMNDQGQYVLKDGSVSPKKKFDSDEALSVTGSKKIDEEFEDTDPVCDFTAKDLVEINKTTSNGSKLETEPKIPYVLKKTKDGDKYDSTGNNYLYKVVVRTDEDDVWTEFTAEDIWGNLTPECGKITKSKSTDRSFVTYAPYMRDYVFQSKGETLGLIKKRSTDWQEDAFNMTHFIIPEVRCNVTIEAYYTTTCPVTTYVYKKSGGKYVLQPSQTTVSWVSAGIDYRTNISSGIDGTVLVATGRKAYTTPYSSKSRKKDSFSSVSKAERYYPDRMEVNTTNGNVGFTMGDEPVVICVFKDEKPPGKYFTQAQYVHTRDGKYYLVSAWKQEIKTLRAPVGCPSHFHCMTEYGPHYISYTTPSVTVRAFVSFPQYVSWDDGTTGLYGSLYEEQGIEYEYVQNVSLPQVTKTKPGRFHTSNNSDIYLTAKGNAAKDDYADRTPGGDNSLVCYCIYEDYFGWWENIQYNPDATKEEDKDNPQTIEEEGLPWNWPLPSGFVWENVDITSKDTVDETQYEDEYTSQYVAQVLSTQGSARYNAQTGIPTTDMVRGTVCIPRYLTKGYWTRHNLAWAYKVHAVYVIQHKSTKTIMAGNNDPDVGKLGHSSTENGPVYCTFDYYESEPVQWEKNTLVERRSVYYTLGDAEVWDPQRVELKNDVFSDSKVTENDVMTLYGYGKVGGYVSNARFFKTDDGAFIMPALNVMRQYVNYGTYNLWELADGEEKLEDDL